MALGQTQPALWWTRTRTHQSAQTFPPSDTHIQRQLRCLSLPVTSTPARIYIKGSLTINRGFLVWGLDACLLCSSFSATAPRLAAHTASSHNWVRHSRALPRVENHNPRCSLDILFRLLFFSQVFSVFLIGSDVTAFEPMRKAVRESNTTEGFSCYTLSYPFLSNRFWGSDLAFLAHSRFLQALFAVTVQRIEI